MKLLEQRERHNAVSRRVNIDPYAAAAIPLNARANGLRISSVVHDVLDDHRPDVDVILAGDCGYEGAPARATVAAVTGHFGQTALVGDSLLR